MLEFSILHKIRQRMEKWDGWWTSKRDSQANKQTNKKTKTIIERTNKITHKITFCCSPFNQLLDRANESDGFCRPGFVCAFDLKRCRFIILLLWILLNQMKIASNHCFRINSKLFISFPCGQPASFIHAFAHLIFNWTRKSTQITCILLLFFVSTRIVWVSATEWLNLRALLGALRCKELAADLYATEK